jgi:predicted Zn-dependent protease
MKKIVFQGLVGVSLLLGTWFILNRINWLEIFRVEQLTNATEQKLGNLFWDTFKISEKENINPVVINSVDSLVTKICNSNKIDRNKIQVHVLDKDEINAFALPNGHLVVYTGLILDADNQEELTGVIGHELAHIELNHVMKKLVKEIGLSVLISMTTGSGGTEAIKEAAKLLSSSAFDRDFEKEADIKAVDYLVKAEVNPEHFANFLYKLSKQEQEEMKYLTWISTHPDSKERAEYIIQYSKGKKANYKPILSKQKWTKMQEELLK